jgi:DNA-binding CsgD family transcriptional regulator
LHGRKYEYDERVKISLLALDKLGNVADKTIWHNNLQTIFCTNIAESYFNNGDFDKAWPYLQESLEIVEKQKVALYNKFNVYSFFAFYYELKREWRKAAEWHEKIIALLKDDATHQHYANQSYLMAATQYYNLYNETPDNKSKLRKELAAKQAKYLEEVSERIKTDVQQSHYLLWQTGMARLEFLRKNYDKALNYLNSCYPAYQKAGHQKAIIDCTGLMHQIYFAWGKQTSDAQKLFKAYEFQKKESELVLADFRQTNVHKLDAIKSRNELQKKELNEKLMRQQMDAINKEMRLTALSLHEKIVLLDELKVYVHSLKEKEFEMRQFINAISNKISSIKITEQDKAMLQQKIDAGNEGLFKILTSLYPALTSHEIQICGLLKTGMTNKELSKLYGLSEKGYEQLRYRIKKKMKLKRTDNLVKHLIALSAKEH